MSKKHLWGATSIGLLIAIVVILGILIFLFGANTTDAPATTNETPTERIADESFTVTELPAAETVDDVPATVEAEPRIEVATPVDQITPSSEPTVVEEQEQPVTTTTSGTYTDYDPALLANATEGSVVLFFHASWCPSCRALDKSINENFSELPADVTILQLDFDTETELKKKYGVVRQHTLVQVDANGDEIKKITGLTNTLDQVLSKL